MPRARRIVSRVVDQEPAEGVERRRELVLIAELAPERDRLLELGPSLAPRRRAGPRAPPTPRAPARAARPVAADAARAADKPLAPFVEQPVREPEPAERAGERERAVRVASRPASRARREGRRGRSRGARTTPPQRRSGAVGVLRERGEVLRVPPAQLLGSRPPPSSRSARVLADRLEHEEAVVADRLQEAGVDERREVVEIGRADLLRGRHGKLPAKTDSRAKTSLLASSTRS